MSTLPKSRLRIAGDFFRFNRLVDLLRPGQTNQFDEEIPFAPRFHGADSLQVEVAIFNDGVLLTDLSAITELELVIKPLHAADLIITDLDDPNPDAVRGPASNVAPIVCKRIGSEHFNDSLTDNQWQTKAADMAHAIITLESEEAALSPGERWLSLIALGADGQARTLAAGPLLILGGGPTFNALPQPVVKDLRDQAAQSAAQAQHSADNAASQAQQAANAATAAQEQVTLATSAAAQAGNAVISAQQAATEAAQARDGSQQFSLNAQASAQAAQQTADQIGDLDAALLQAADDADRAQIAATAAAGSQLAAATYATATNPNSKEAASGIHTAQEGGGQIDSLSINDLSQGGTQSFTLAWAGRVSARGNGNYNTLFGSTRGASVHSAGSAGLAVGNATDPGQAVFVAESGSSQYRLASGINIMDRDVVVVGVFDAGTRTASIYVDGVFAASADWSAATLESTHPLRCMLATTNTGAVDTAPSPTGTQRIATAFNSALTPVEIAEYSASGGQVVPISAQGGLLAPLYASDFSSSVDGWNVGVFNATYGVSHAGEDGCMRLEILTGSQAIRNMTTDVYSLIGVGNRAIYEVSLKVYIPSTNSVVKMVRLDSHVGGQPSAIVSSAVDGEDVWVETKAQWNIQTTPGSLFNYIRLRNAAGASPADAAGEFAYIKDVKYRRLGNVLHLPCNDGAGYQLRDHSGNANHALLTEAGCAHLKPGEHFEFTWTRISSGFLGDADRPVLPENAVIESVIWEDVKGTRTTASLGFNASNVAAHVASFTPAHARQSAVLAAGSMAVADRRLYLNMSDNAGTVTVRIQGRIL